MKKPNKLLFLGFFNLLFLSAAFAQATDNGSLTGTVFTFGGSPIPNAIITITHSDSCAKRIATTNEEGRWTSAVLRIGEHEVTFEASGYQKTKEIVTVEGNITKTVDETLEVGDDKLNSEKARQTENTIISSFSHLQEGALKGTVFNPAGGVISNAVVTVRNMDNCGHNTVKTDYKGRWTIKRLPYGKYRIVYEAAGFETAKEVFTINSAAPTNIDKVLNIDTANPNTVDNN